MPSRVKYSAPRRLEVKRPGVKAGIPLDRVRLTISTPMPTVATFCNPQRVKILRMQLASNDIVIVSSGRSHLCIEPAYFSKQGRLPNFYPE